MVSLEFKLKENSEKARSQFWHEKGGERRKEEKRAEKKKMFKIRILN